MDWTFVVAFVLLAPGLILLIAVVGYLGFAGRNERGDGNGSGSEGQP